MLPGLSANDEKDVVSINAEPLGKSNAQAIGFTGGGFKGEANFSHIRFGNFVPWVILSLGIMLAKRLRTALW